MSPSTPSIALPQMPTAPQTPMPFSLMSAGNKPGRKSTIPSVLGAAAQPSQANAGWKTLLGQ